MDNTDTSAPSDEGVPENVASLSILVQLLMLGTTFVIGHVLRRKRILLVHEAGAALLLGCLVGLLVTFIGEAKGFREWIDFNNSFFFYFLLPPIIFESGWSLKTKPFFDNFEAICVFAFGGTLLSTFGVGILVWIFGAIHFTYQMPFLVCLTFGALISATDPVTVLAIFNELGADANLYAYVFGESVLNDAVAIVMYKTVLSFVTHPGSHGIFGAFWFFIVIFIGSFSIGVVVSMLSALLFKYGGFQERELGILESCLVVLFPYAAYMMADAMHLSGIVAILFAGITMKYYTAPNLSKQAKDITTQFFMMLAKLSETFVFIYMGVAMFLEKQSWDNIGFAFFTIISILLARVINVYPCAYLINYYREPARHIPKNQQHALWFGGLRGAMAFALSLQSVTDLPDNHGRVLLTSTLFTIFFTVLLIGGSTPTMLQYLEIECHGPSGHEEIDLPESPTLDEEESPGADDEIMDYEDVSGQLQMLTLQKKKLQKKLRQLKADTSFATLDKKYLKPFFAANARDDLDSEASPHNHGDGGQRAIEMEIRQGAQAITISEHKPQDFPHSADIGSVENYNNQQRHSDHSTKSLLKNNNYDYNSQKMPENLDGASRSNEWSFERYSNWDQTKQASSDKHSLDQQMQRPSHNYNNYDRGMQRISNSYKNSEQSNPKVPDRYTSGPNNTLLSKFPDTLPITRVSQQNYDDGEPLERTERRSLLLENTGSFPKFLDKGTVPSMSIMAARLKEGFKKSWR